MKTWKHFIGMAILAIFAFVLAFTGCNNGGDSGDDTGNIGNTGNNGEAMNPKGANVYLEDGTIMPGSARVMLEIEGYFNDENDYFEERIEIGDITNGKLSFTMPNVSDIVNGFSLEEIIGGGGSTYTVINDDVAVNPSDAKAFLGELYIVYTNEEYGLFYGNETTSAFYLYLNKPTTIKGTITYDYSNYTSKNIDTYNCDFKSGWNVVYQTLSVSGPSDNRIYSLSNSTNPPTNASMRWFVDD